MTKDLVSIDDLALGEIQAYLDLATRMEAMDSREKLSLLRGRILAVLFYEPSTRTALSFKTAMYRLGGEVIGFSQSAKTSVAKGESVRDTVLTVERYADAIVIRHPREGTARLAAEVSRVPVINAGDGANQHPSQTLLDLYTIQKSFGRIDGLRIALAGDLKYSRTVHSLVPALMKFDDVQFLLVSPPELRLPDYLRGARSSEQAAFRETTDLSEAFRTSDLVYMTRIQKERFVDLVEYEKVKDSYCIQPHMLEGAPAHFRILHPLPRVNEIHPSVDETPHAGYFEQVGNGVIMRQAILLAHLEVMR